MPDNKFNNRHFVNGCLAYISKNQCSIIIEENLWIINSENVKKTFVCRFCINSHLTLYTPRLYKLYCCIHHFIHSFFDFSSSPLKDIIWTRLTIGSVCFFIKSFLSKFKQQMLFSWILQMHLKKQTFSFLIIFFVLKC